ncbi:hypothetical protein Nepgr_028933 [Nepenthes gracilis]|uniref:Uncharacterized protein n=1 Tax=Nepenthes gracilis TaxID=150966 RepID=A0AAD3Y4E0_NEPGR|nr:hypothetical protein Nepgr_028933 [Nepenthes gracilis]
MGWPSICFGVSWLYCGGCICITFAKLVELQRGIVEIAAAFLYYFLVPVLQFLDLCELKGFLWSIPLDVTPLPCLDAFGLIRAAANFDVGSGAHMYAIAVSTRFDFRSENSIMFKPSLFYPSGNRWTDIKEIQTNIPGFSLKLETAVVAPLRSLEKVDISRAPKKKGKKKASKARDLYEKNYTSACEKLPQLLTQFSASIAGMGLAVIFSVICKMACGKAPLSITKLVTTGVGFGLFWLSWVVNALRRTLYTSQRILTSRGSKKR